MITYSTSWMGPISLDWYRDRGLVKDGAITAYYCAGRIDIRGLDPEKYWSGCSEYSIPAMHGEDWNALSEWLVGLETTELLEFDDIIAQYEQQSERKIRWYKDGHLEEQESKS